MKARSRTAVVAVTAGTLLGCQGVTRHVTESPSPCFQILPAADAAVEGQGRYVSVVRLRGTRADSLLRTARGANTSTASGPEAGPAGSDPARDVCAVVYRGSFDPTRVQPLFGTATKGAYAVVLVGLKSHHVRAVILTDHLDPPLRRR